MGGDMMMCHVMCFVVFCLIYILYSTPTVSFFIYFFFFPWNKLTSVFSSFVPFFEFWFLGMWLCCCFVVVLCFCLFVDEWMTDSKKSIWGPYVMLSSRIINFVRRVWWTTYMTNPNKRATPDSRFTCRLAVYVVKKVVTPGSDDPF